MDAAVTRSFSRDILYLPDIMLTVTTSSIRGNAYLSGRKIIGLPMCIWTKCYFSIREPQSRLSSPPTPLAIPWIHPQHFSFAFDNEREEGVFYIWRKDFLFTFVHRIAIWTDNFILFSIHIRYLVISGSINRLLLVDNWLIEKKNGHTRLMQPGLSFRITMAWWEAHASTRITHRWSSEA